MNASTYDQDICRMIRDLWHAAYRNDAYGYPISESDMMKILTVLGFKSSDHLRQLVAGEIRPLLALEEAVRTIHFARIKH